MKFLRYRKPSLRGLLGVTRAIKGVKRASGLTSLLRPFRAPGNLLRRVKRRSGYYPINRVLKGQFPTPLDLGGPSRARGLSQVGCLLLLALVWLLWRMG